MAKKDNKENTTKSKVVEEVNVEETQEVKAEEPVVGAVHEAEPVIEEVVTGEEIVVDGTHEVEKESEIEAVEPQTEDEPVIEEKAEDNHTPKPAKLPRDFVFSWNGISY